MKLGSNIPTLHMTSKQHTFVKEPGDGGEKLQRIAGLQKLFLPVMLGKPSWRANNDTEMHPKKQT